MEQTKGRRAFCIGLSILIALLVWFYANDDTEIEISVNDVPIEFTNEDTTLADKGLMLLSNEEETIDLKLSMPRSTYFKLDPGKIRIVVDLSSVTTTGTQTITYSVLYPRGPRGELLSSSITQKEPTVRSTTIEIGELFRNLESSFKKVRAGSRNTTELDLLELEFFYIRGRYLIRDGSYDDGVNDIIHVIDKSKQLGNRDYMLEGYKQMILYYLQINSAKDMAEYVGLALDLAVRCNYHKEIGIILRLKGLCHYMMGNYTQAEKLLTESINTLAVTETIAKRYATNIAAAYNYIGEIRLAHGTYREALELFQKAISLCVGKNALASLSYFYINAGKTAYYLEDLSMAREFFDKAYALYGQFDSFWRRSVLDSYMALTLLRQGEYGQAVKYLPTARENVGYIKDPNDLGVVFFAEAVFRQRCDLDPEGKTAVGDRLPDSVETYSRQALEQLNIYCNQYEVKLLTHSLLTK